MSIGLVIEAALKRAVEPSPHIFSHGLAARVVSLHAVIDNNEIGAKPRSRTTDGNRLPTSTARRFEFEGAIAAIADASVREIALIPFALHDPARVVRVLTRKILAVARYDYLESRIMAEQPRHERNRRGYGFQVTRWHGDYQPRLSPSANFFKLVTHGLDVPRRVERRVSRMQRLIDFHQEKKEFCSAQRREPCLLLRADPHDSRPSWRRISSRNISRISMSVWERSSPLPVPCSAIGASGTAGL